MVNQLRRQLSRRDAIRRTVAATLAAGLDVAVPKELSNAGPALEKVPVAGAAATTAASAPGARYRYQQPRLFQPIPAATIPPRLPGTEGYPREAWGPTHVYVDRAIGWPWDRAGGDWIDADDVRYGSQPWFSIPTNSVSGPTAVAGYELNVTTALRKVQRSGRWCAFLLRTRGAPRSVAGLHHARFPGPRIEVTYQDGSQATLRCLLIASLSPGSEVPATTAPHCTLPAVAEFDRPAQPIVAARLVLAVVEHWSGAGVELDGFILDPGVNTRPVVQGIAASAGLLDAGLAQKPSVIGLHRYLDEAPWTDFVSTGRGPLVYNLSAERNFDPAIFERGATDKGKFPHLDLGKWIAISPGWSKVGSVYRGEEFEPLAPNLGAVRVHMPAAPGVKDGSNIGYDGTIASNAFVFLPEPDFGRLKRIFVRYYLRIAPYVATAAQRYEVRQDGSYAWTDMAGKTGITPSHTTTYGGVSGSSGGGYGWQMRLGWGDCDADLGGPDERGITLNVHTYDFLGNNPVQHGDLDRPKDVALGQQGGIGGILYYNKWYCVEMEVDLNTVMPEAPGYLQDGAVRMWIDGRLAMEHLTMVMRSLPLERSPYSPDHLRPCRELGHRDLWLNWFHGGKTANTIDRTLFFTGLVWARSYIGPMRLV